MASKRQIEKQPCSKCSGSGKVADTKREICPNCNSKGWYLNGTGVVEVCKSCNGDGYKDRRIETDCEICYSKGFLVRVVESSPKTVSCPQCKGDKNYRTVISCKKCNGTGFRPMRDDFLNDAKSFRCSTCSGSGISDRTECFDCEGKGFHYSCTCQKGLIKEKCPKCKGHGKLSTGENDLRVIQDWSA
jgi:DnaJ-class molecular chaperone